MEPIAKEVGLRIRRYRLDRCMTQEDLAEHSNLHQTYIGQVERGEKNLTVGSLEKILSALNVTFSELFENIEDVRHPESIPALCNQLIRSKSAKQQDHLYHILLELDHLLQP